MKPREMLKGRLLTLEDISEFKKQVKERNKKIVFTSGNWDMIHIGQMRYLAEAKKHGDILVAGVQSNEAIKKVKGPNKPILDEMIRAESLVFLKSVDYVVINPNVSSKVIIELLQPDVYISVKEEWNGNYKESKEYKAVIEYGGKFEIVDRQSLSVSTSQIIDKILGAKVLELFAQSLKEAEGPVKERFQE